ncbi:MAG TPA: nuclear transport factor 2 family protein [Devosiaceae bacterium]|nr:nuclear transport factor 2 family protein [Devosiaceae bacterium]
MSARDILRAYEDRINRHDFETLSELIAEDAVFWFSDGSHHGLAEIRTAFERTWRTLSDETYWLEERRWLAEGDLAAACTYRFHWRAVIEGRAASGAGRGTTVLGLRNGRWQIVHEHLSADPD